MIKRVYIFLIFCLLCVVDAFPAHIFGGEMVYQYIGAGDLPNSKKYRIILKLFRDDDGGGAQLPTNVFIGVFDYGTKQHYPTTQNYHDVPRTSGPTIVNMNVSPCATGNTSGNYSVAEYSFIIDLPNNSQGYIAAYETCCRRNGLANVDHPGGVGGAGSTYVCKIPGSNQIPISQHNSSPQFITSLDLVCRNTQFSWNFSATDPDGDSLAYAFTAGYNKTTASTAANIPPATPSITLPDYPLLTYINGFTGNIPLGTLASINPQTGIISGIAPELGFYVTCVIVYEYRNGVLIGEHRKDFILRIQDCDIPEATLSPRPTTCDGFSLNFVNETPSPLINSYFWDFGVSNAVNDTSNLAAPSFTFPDTGIYIVKLVTNRGQQCADSTSTVVRIFPGFFPGFIYTGSCFTNPYQFTDTTNTRYGVVDSWRWDFGDLATLSDTSRIRNPQYTYPNPGPRDVRLIVTNSKGCIDTAIVRIDILDKPLITLAFKDTLICVPDAVTLNASGTGSFNWTPLTNITNPNTANPTVNPTTDTWYVANLNDNGCSNKDSVRVRVISGVTLTVMPDTTICLTDGVTLNAVTNGLSFNWTPAASLSNPTILNPVATPTAASTIYQLTASVGSCSTTDFVIINTDPYPVANAGPPQVVCYNTSAQLNGAHNGTRFTWTPVNYLNNPNILNPIASPPRTTSFILTSWDDTPGCPKPGYDTVVVTVQPRVRAYAGRDTTVVVGQRLQLLGSGGVRYLWTPGTGLNNPNIANPVGTYGPETDSVRYKLLVADAAGCLDSSFVTVRVFKTNPNVFVPTAFTPNGDGRNDVVRPISVGIEKINYFSIYNRWGERVFYTTADRAGWDGKVGGTPQASGVYVWMVSAIDYLGKPIFLKGTVTLIR